MDAGINNLLLGEVIRYCGGSHFVQFLFRTTHCRFPNPVRHFFMYVCIWEVKYMCQ